MPQIDSIRLAARLPARPFAGSFAHRARLTHSPTHRACIHYITRRHAARRSALPFMEAQREEEKRRVAICWLFREFNVESKPSIGQRVPLLLSSGFWHGRDRVRPCVRQWECNGMCQRRIPLLPLPSRYLRNARARIETDYRPLHVCGVWRHCLSKVRRPRDAAKRLLKSAAAGDGP